MEIGDDRLKFLDVNNNIIEFDWYRKPTFSDRYLNFLSHCHPISQKKGMITGSVDKVILFSNSKFHFDDFW